MSVTNDNEKKAYTAAVNALTTVTLDEAKVKTLNYNALTVEQWVTNASTAKVKGTEAVANGEFFVANEGEKTIALTGTIADLKSNIDKVKKAAPAFTGVSFTDVSSNESTPSFEAETDKVYISKDPKTNADTVYVVGEDLNSILGANFVDITSKSPVNTISDLSGYSSGTSQYAVVRLDANSKVVSYTFVTLKDQ